MNLIYIPLHMNNHTTLRNHLKHTACTHSYWRRRCGAPDRSLLLFILCTGTKGSAVIFNNPPECVDSSACRGHMEHFAAPQRTKNCPTVSPQEVRLQTAPPCINEWPGCVLHQHMLLSPHIQLCQVSGLKCSLTSEYGHAQSQIYGCTQSMWW